MSGSYTDDDLSNTSATENQADNSIASSSSAQSDRKRRNSEVATEAKIKVTKKSVILAHTKQITVNGEKMLVISGDVLSNLTSELTIEPTSTVLPWDKILSQQVSCTLEPNCTYMQKVFRSQNFARHFRIAHPSAYNLLCIGEPSLNKDDNPDPSVVIRTSKQKVVGGIVKIHTLHGLPFEAVEWEGFRDILEPQLKAFDLKINRHNVTEYIKTTDDGIDWLIKQELAGLTVSLKLDIVSKMYRSFLGVNCQYVSNHGIIIKRTLGIIELHNRHTGQNLKEELIMVLKHFGLEIGQAISITIDNASNMVKMVQLMSKQAESMEEHSLSELVPEKTQQTWAKALEEAVPDEFITTIRCGAHTTQLVVHDVCRETEFKEILKEIRKKCKKFRSAEYTAFFEAGEGAYPPLPNETRWGSDYRLMLSMKNGKKFSSTWESNTPSWIFQRNGVSSKSM
nr:uncharacterized protein LOC115268145 [Aedes albopictus]